MSNSRMSQIFNVTFYLICFVGCSLHIFDLVQLYFQYNTRTDILLDIPNTVSAPVASICMRYSDILCYECLLKDKKIPKMIDLLDVQDIRKMQDLLTIKEIFDYTPMLEHVVESCRSRPPNTYDVFYWNGSECSE